MSKTKISWLITDHNITVNYEGQTHIVSRSSGNLGEQLIKAIKENNLDEIPHLVSIAKRLEKSSNGTFTVVDGTVFVNGFEAPKVLSDKIIKFSEEGLPYAPLVKFAENLQKNPSFRAVNELYQFLEKNNHPLTDNGCFIAYKRVRGDFKDIYSGTFDNSPGKTVEMPRNKVNENPNETCSYGLHVANWNYAHNLYGHSGSGEIMLEVEVNPADVVAVPVDYNQSKMRTCKYKVLGVVDKEHSSDTSLRITNTSNIDLDEEMDDEEEFCEGCGNHYCEGDCDAGDDYPWDDELKF